ncbi:hypothetical protein BDZ85DRAFT_320676 [Elsinoe ampelina]|uniref:C2H2-type domain-containing protein n=1 Tax=Elsinoe ampelina TaxID=302913 RepID=A0A6A6G747_9PEZI|nr:hypothetical protein BDZ85DRAFT_320676 [Elsinoe ampelina]
MDDLNSSDFEDLPDEHDKSIFKPNPNVGKRVSEAILLNQATDRPLSKKNARQLTFARGAPKTREAQQSVMAVWDTFCQTIKHDIKQCPSGEQIFRFIDVRARHTRPGLKGKTQPSLSVIRGIWRRLIDLLKFRHEDLPTNYTTYWVNRIGMHLDQLVTQKVLVRGTWFKRQWLGYKVIHRISEVWIDRALAEGCLSWDRVLLKLLGVVLQASCACRSGDIARSSLYTGMECLCWEHLSLTFKDNKRTGSVDDLSLKVTLEFTKGHKSANNESVVVFIDPMSDPSQNVVCVVKLLLVVALRFGRVKHTSLDAVLAEAAARRDGEVQWSAPKTPVLCQMARGISTLSYDKPAHQSQIRNALQDMSLAAGILVPVNTRFIRNGALRDVAYLSKSIKGVSDRCTALVANHTTKALDKGTNQDYIGHLQAPIWNMRAVDPFENRLAPKFADTPFNAPKFTQSDIDEYMDKQKMNKEDNLQRTKAGKQLKKAAESAWRLEQQDALISRPRPAQALRTKTASEVNKPVNAALPKKAMEDLHTSTVAKPVNQPRTTSKSISMPPKQTQHHANFSTVDGPETHISTQVTVPAPSKSTFMSMAPRINTTHVENQHSSFSVPPESAMDESNIDPLLLLDDIETLDVDEEQLDWIRDLIDQTGNAVLDEQLKTDNDAGDSDSDDIDDEAIVHVLTDDLNEPQTGAQNRSKDVKPSELNGNDFVAVFAGINVYRLKRSFDSSNAAVVAQYIPTGNSRDAPTPYLYRCSKCEYTNRWHHVVQTHEVACTKDKSTATKEKHACPYENCKKSYIKEETLKAHISTTHEYVPRPCPRCDDQPEVLFETYNLLQKHLREEHDDLPNPMKCPFSDICGNEKEFTTKKHFKAHLRAPPHLKTPKEIESFVVRKKTTRAKFRQQCPLGTCQQDDVFTSASQLRKHLVKEHDMSVQHAELQVPLTKREEGARKRKAKKAEVEDSDSDEDDDGEDGDDEVMAKAPPAKRARKQ